MNRKIVTSLLIGICAGVIDILPGILNGVDFRITLAGFSFWVAISFIVAHVSLPIKDWLKGLVVSLIMAIPGTFLLSLVDPSSVIPMIIITIVLGTSVGFLTGKFAR
jgi:hypothetical protein